ncbi:MAG: HAD family phosphatase [Anaerolineaceae bacterium]|nr:HAD family phosphatase [Anaerolineaceae bacterium]
MSSIKGVIWDLAGVVLFPIRGTFDSLLAERLGVPAHEIGRAMRGEETILWDTGEMDDDAFFTYLLKELRLPLEKISAIRQFMFHDFRVDQKILTFIKRIKKTHTTALLTNFPSHLHTLMKTDWIIESAFDHIIASCDVKLVKPDPALYKLALDRMGFKAEECVFIDDRQVNVDAAAGLGIHSILYQNRGQAIKDIETILK